MKYFLTLALTALHLFAASSDRYNIQSDENGNIHHMGYKWTNNISVSTGRLDGIIVPSNSVYGLNISELVVESKNNVRLFGAIPNDGLDDSAAFQTAINRISTSSVPILYVPPGDWLWTNKVITSNSISIIGPAGIGIARITSTYNAGPSLVLTSAPMTQLPDIASDVSIGATNITLASAHNLAGDNWIIAHNDNDSSYSTARANYEDGDMWIVGDILSSTSFSLTSPNLVTFTGVTNKFWKVNYNTFILRNLNFVVPTNVGQPTIIIANSRNSQITDCIFNNGDHSVVYFNRAYNPYVNNNVARSLEPTIGNNYAFVGSGVYFGRWFANSGVVNRHFYSLGGGTEDGHIVNRFNHFFGGHQKSFGVSWAIDLHGNCEYNKIESTFSDGIAFAGDHNEVINNIVNNNNASGYGIVAAEMKGLNGIVSGNKGYITRFFSNGFISLYARTNIQNSSTMIVENNYIDAGIFVTNATKLIEFGITGGAPPNTNIAMIIRDNIFKSADVTTGTNTLTAYAIYGNFPTTISAGFKRLVVQDNIAHKLGYYLDAEVVDAHIQDNKSYDAVEYGIRTPFRSSMYLTNQSWHFEGNFVTGSKLNPFSFVGKTNGVDVYARDNTFKNGSITLASSAFAAAGIRRLWYYDNIVGDDRPTADATQNRTDSLGTITYLMEGRNYNPGRNVNSLASAIRTGIYQTINLEDHTHEIADITGLQTILDSKQPLSSELTDIDTTAPGVNKYYGTDGTGTKGFYSLTNNYQYVAVTLTNILADLATGATHAYYIFPVDGTIRRVWANLSDPSSSGNVVIDVNIAGSTIMTTDKITIGAVTNVWSGSYVTQPVITLSNFTAGQVITFDVDSAGTDAKGGQAVLEWYPR